MVLANARVVTMDPARPDAGAVAISGDRIVGVAFQAEELAAAGDRIVDLGGRWVVPGFNDCHMHVLPYGVFLGQADLSCDAGVTSASDLVRVLREWAEKNPYSGWVVGNRFDHNAFPGAQPPRLSDLDAAFPDCPVFLSHTSGHAAVANTVALRIAGISSATPDPDAGLIERDAAGEPTGLLSEGAAGLVARHAPRPNRAEMVAAIERACAALVRVGVTSATDMGVTWFDFEDAMRAYPMAADQGVPVRITLYPELSRLAQDERMPDRSRYLAESGIERSGREGVGGLRIGGAKLFADGALTTRTAALREPYTDGSGSGMLLHSEQVLAEMVGRAHRAGWQVAAHAIGDRANAAVLGAIEQAQTGDTVRARRHRIEHGMMLDAGLVRLCAEQRAVVVMQPEFVARLGDAYVLGLGEERAARLNPVASLLRAGASVAFSSDCPVVPGAPLDGIRAACERRTRSGRVLGPDEAVSPMDALACYTRGAAHSTFDAREAGCIAPGKRADLAVLEAEDEGPDALLSARVVATIAGGVPVFGSEVFS